MRAPKSVLLVLDWLVETQAINRHWKLPRIRVGNGHHSAAERRWDQHRRDQVAEDLGAHRLVRLPQDEKQGLAELIGVSRRTVIRAKAWLVDRGLVHVHHANGVRPLSYPYGYVGRHNRTAFAGIRTHVVPRGGCLAGGVGCASEWIAGAEPSAPEPPYSPPEPGPGRPPRRPLGEIAAEQRPPVHYRPRGP